MIHSETAQLETALLPLIVARNAYLIELTFKKSKYGKVIEVFIDTETGVSSDLCADLSRDFNEVLETFDFLQGKYDLVVSSPGLDRPLKFPKQYPRHKGHPLVIKHKVNNATVIITGILTDVSESGIVLELEKGERKEFSFEEIVQANVKPKW